MFKQGTISQSVTCTRIFSYQCDIQEDKEETSKWKCQANVISMEDVMNCQSNKCVNKWSVIHEVICI